MISGGLNDLNSGSGRDEADTVVASAGTREATKEDVEKSEDSAMNRERQTKSMINLQ